MRERGLVPLSLRHRLGGYQEFVAPPQLARWSEAVWIYRMPSDAALPAGAMHRVLPDPALSLAFCSRRESDGRPAEPRLVVIGPVTTPRVFTFHPGYEMAAVKVKLEWVQPLLGVRPGDHHDALDDLSLVLPRLATRLLERLVQTRSPEQAVALLAAALERAADRAQARRVEVAASALDLVRRTAGRLSVERIASEIGASLRHLRRTVHRDAGVSLKAYARTLRLLHAVTTADRRAQPPAWARVAAESGFYDQSHLVRDFRALCGLLPSQVYRERRAEVVLEAEISNRR